MRNLDETTITQAVLATHHSAADGRLSEVMTSLVQHLHAFARDIKLSEAEWRRGIAFLEQAAGASPQGQAEFALLSHVLGLHKYRRTCSGFDISVQSHIILLV